LTSVPVTLPLEPARLAAAKGDPGPFTGLPAVTDGQLPEPDARARSRRRDDLPAAQLGVLEAHYGDEAIYIKRDQSVSDAQTQNL
jgi:hypothetical protein